MAWFIGLMSGTSLDGVDGVLAELDASTPGIRARAHLHAPLPEPLRCELLALNRSGADELHRAALATHGLMACYAEVCMQLLARSGMAATQVRAIGAHGQTVRHRPREFLDAGYSLQLMNGARLAECTGIDVVCDFRSRDIAAGGEGAPLVPAFHAACFSTLGVDKAVLNLGGIANLTLLRADASVAGFDCGPGNLLLDAWCLRHRGAAFDDGGGWAAGGQVQAALLGRLLGEPYFQRRPPKSTGRDLFGMAWLDPLLAGSDLPPQDVMATLVELTAVTVADALAQEAGATRELLVCGGGARNAQLLRRIASRIGPQTRLRHSDEAGVPADQVEALAFAWLASAFLDRRPGNLPRVTGARGPRVLGALYPAG
jgi:anhydro-N-acetylmuramic acid kinase